MSLCGKVVLVTGGSSGIGAAVARGYAAEGADVAIVGRNEAKLQDVAKAIEGKNRKPLIIEADISNDNEAKLIVQRTVEEFGKLDVLVNNAGITRLGSVLDGNLLRAYDETLATNLRAAVHITSLAAPHLVATKGNIVNISSVGGTYVPEVPQYVSYAVSKAGLDHFTRCVALELAPMGVRVNCVKPGPVKTDIVENSGFTGDQAEMVWNRFKTQTALNKIAESEEVADLVLYLTSEKARSVTGATFVIDNGWLLKN